MVLRESTERPRRRKRALSAGQAIVEFALITPVFFLVFFSIVEFALITASIGSYDFGVRDGARVGAIFGPTDPCIDTDPGTTAVTCSTSTTGGTVTVGPTGITGILYTIKGHAQGIVMAKATEIDIYDADPASGLCISSTGPVPIDTGGCKREEYSVSSNWTFTNTINNWPASTRNDSVANDDYLGVRVSYQYTYVTGFVAGLGTNLSLSATSVQEIEPQTTDVQHRGPSAAFAGTRDSPRVVTIAARLPAGSPDSPVCLDVAPSTWWLRKGPGGCA